MSKAEARWHEGQMSEGGMLHSELGRAVHQTPTRRGHMQHVEHERLVTPVAWDRWC